MNHLLSLFYTLVSIYLGLPWVPLSVIFNNGNQYASAVVSILVNQWMRNGSEYIFEHSQLFGGTWPWAYQALCYSCGYFAYDQWDMLHYRLYSGWIPSILMHHLVLLVCFTLALYRNVTINYLILTLICEVCQISPFSIRLPVLVRLWSTSGELLFSLWYL